MNNGIFTHFVFVDSCLIMSEVTKIIKLLKTQKRALEFQLPLIVLIKMSSFEKIKSDHHGTPKISQAYDSAAKKPIIGPIKKTVKKNFT